MKDVVTNIKELVNNKQFNNRAYKKSYPAMQNIGLLFLAILLSFTGCNGDEGQLPTEELVAETNQNLYGTWQLVRKYQLETGWESVSYNYTPYIKIQEDQIFETNLGGCATGEFVVKGNTIQFNYNCENFACGASGFLCEGSFSFKDDFLLLDSEVVIGGISKFKKIKEEDIVEDPTEEVKQEEHPIHGTWQLKEARLWAYHLNGIGFTEDVYKISNGYTVTFRIDNTFSSTQFTICEEDVVNGSFSLSQEQGYSGSPIYNFVEVSYQCVSIDHEWTIRNGYIFENEYLILSPLCPEACNYKYKRVSEQ